MKVALFIFLVLMNCSTLFAYGVEITKLTDEIFNPLPKDVDVRYMGSIDKYQNDCKDIKQIATITLGFLVDEIGQDQGAVRILATKEAAKLGANKIYWVSGTEYTNTGQIASSTYRCSRDENLFLIDLDNRPKQYTENKFEVQKDGKVIHDKTTGLMWQQSGSEEYMPYNKALNYISQLNQEGFAGYKDWRLPTLKESITLLKPEQTSNVSFVDPVFDKKQWGIWTSDLSGASRPWGVYFDGGYCDYSSFNSLNYVRAVR